MYDVKIYSKLNDIIKTKNEYQIPALSKVREKECEKFKLIFNYCLNRLDYEYRHILVSSYFSDTYKFWWIDFYSKSSFYRKRIKAIASFVLLFEVVYENFNDFTANFSHVCF